MSDEYLNDMMIEYKGINIGKSELSSTDNLNSNEEDLLQPSTSSQISKHNLHMRSKHHISKAMIESSRVKIITKDNNKCELFVTAESSQLTIDRLLSVIRDVSTRWNTTFYLLKWLTVLKSAMYKYKLLLVESNDNNSLKNYKEKELLFDDWNKITELVKLLHPYEIISKKLLGSQYPTFSQMWFVINFIKVKLEYAITNNAIVQKFRDSLYKLI
ncbi:15555_t:CDS:2 [Cetraspora pellucida]|uniref:15555_t:CDS:1 n=1 Tax=Cetraspora pellucida TaxID=1433469 RepID=A0A9N9JTW7_9GLOM|nr:15555_t:CDS:2 [Cetraspora pellucida]